MISNQDRKRCIAAVLLGLLGLAGCSAEKAPEFCKNHGPFHEQHRDELGSLSVTMTADGYLRSEVRLPMAAVGADSAALLETASNVYTLQ
ncbi:MAG: hypothetical protein O2805_10745, partial [Proteobacteria bacterium]|nr:hypothetical protein [Pseudomonadota bacterium]